MSSLPDSTPDHFRQHFIEMIELPASRIDEDVQTVMDADSRGGWSDSIEARLDSATISQLMQLARGGIGEPHE